MQKEWIDLHRQGRLAEAEQGYREHLASQPDDVEVLHLLGLLRHQRGDTAEGLRLLGRAQQLAPADAAIETALASLHFRDGAHDLAQRGFERALTLDPNLSGAHAGIGQMAVLRGDVAAAERHFRVALRADEDPNALAGLGALALERGDIADALRLLGRAADIAPGDAMIQMSLGQAFARNGSLTFARQAFENALRLHPQLDHARPMLAQVLMRTKDRRAAELHYRHLLGVPGFALIGQLGVADVARAEGRFDEAVKGYRAALVVDPAHVLGARALATALSELGRHAEALAALDDLLGRVDDDAARTARADVLLMLGRMPEAHVEWKRLAARRPDDLVAHARHALIAERLGHFDSARAEADFVLRAAPDEADIRLVRIRALLREGDDATARVELEAMPALPLRWTYLGHVHDRAGEFDAAARCFALGFADAPAAMPSLAEPPAALAAALDEPTQAPWPAAPVLLLGTPGSGVERIAALFSDCPGITVMRDRIAGDGRDDDFTWPRFAEFVGPLSEGARDILRERYLAPIRRAGYSVTQTIVDWLPRWDAHLLALVRRAMPGTRLVIVERDPRDALINWLGFGWGHGFPCKDPFGAAAWLARARGHLHTGTELDDPLRIVVDADEILDDPLGAGAELARFVGVEALRPGIHHASMMHTLGGLPARFQRGHWQRYRETLGSAFALLQ